MIWKVCRLFIICIEIKFYHFRSIFINKIKSFWIHSINKHFMVCLKINHKFQFLFFIIDKLNQASTKFNNIFLIIEKLICFRIFHIRSFEFFRSIFVLPIQNIENNSVKKSIAFKIRLSFFKDNLIFWKKNVFKRQNIFQSKIWIHFFL
jgi:hypothetical protein